MITDDLSCLRNRFLDTVGADASMQIVMANQPNATIDETKLWCRFTVQPGSALPYIPGYTQQLGLASLQVFVPRGDGTADGFALADQFLTAFRDWRSADEQTSTYKSDMSINDNSDFFQINAYVYWKSLRAN